MSRGHRSSLKRNNTLLSESNRMLVDRVATLSRQVDILQKYVDARRMLMDLDSKKLKAFKQAVFILRRQRREYKALLSEIMTHSLKLQPGDIVTEVQKPDGRRVQLL